MIANMLKRVVMDERLGLSDVFDRDQSLFGFVLESNAIEQIPLNESMSQKFRKDFEASVAFMNLEEVSVNDLVDFVGVIQPGARLRNYHGMDVMVGSYYPPGGGPEIEKRLRDLLKAANAKDIQPYDAHAQYEALHPFSDGNGRSGRIFWRWMMMRSGRRNAVSCHTYGFLHLWYYQSLDNYRSPSLAVDPNRST